MKQKIQSFCSIVERPNSNEIFLLGIVIWLNVTTHLAILLFHWEKTRRIASSFTMKLSQESCLFSIKDLSYSYNFAKKNHTKIGQSLNIYRATY